ncbi:hypothetical protein ACIBBE_24505 [Streptomyces sp. NPDC051644]|uniref:hypothetical protein n=1 Tax=Streptomyces sp. NPDC051644 TaxID=3365666 RepID=UPI0037B1409A
MTQSAPQTATINTLAADLRNALSDGWTVTARFDHILAVTSLCDRIEIRPLAYSYTDVHWTLVPVRRTVAAETVREMPDTDPTADMATALRNLSYRHHALPTA